MIKGQGTENDHPGKQKQIKYKVETNFEAKTWTIFNKIPCQQEKKNLI